MVTENRYLASALADAAVSPSSFGALQFRLDGGESVDAHAVPRQTVANEQIWLAQPHPHWHWHDGTLSPNEFLRDVQREKRRAERSRSPTSLVSYRLDDAAAQDPYQLDRLLATLHGSKRETDALGHIKASTVAVLCPNTDEVGAQRFIQKMQPQLQGVACSVLAATYPDDLFDSLAKGVATDAAFQPFLVAGTATGGPGGSGGYPLKRTIDLTTALLLLVLFAPLMVIVAAAIRLTSPGPAVYRQRRLGKNGVPFTFYKFRSMTANVDDRIHRDFVTKLIKDGAPREAVTTPQASTYKLKNDARITRVGRLIRATSVDELPQIINVLKGDMSMVGPRPPISYEAVNYEPWHLQRILTVRPGITGLWQVEGRSRVTFSEMVRMDLRYIRDCSPRLDLKILLKTVLVVIRCDGAS